MEGPNLFPVKERDQHHRPFAKMMKVPSAFFVAILWVAVASASLLPQWNVGIVPSTKINASAGLPQIQNALHITVYNATKNAKRNPFGTYNHGPILAELDGTFFMSWYNAPTVENNFKRSVFAYSTDQGSTWSEPGVLFTNFTVRGQENGPWTYLPGDGDRLPNRLYTQSGTQDAGLHIEGIVSVMRQVGLDGPTKLGKSFWLNGTVPKGFEHLGFPTYLEMDSQTRKDAEQIIKSMVRTTVKYPDVAARHHGKMVYNERSLYMVPGTRRLVNLLRGQYAPKNLSASTCTLPYDPRAVPLKPNPTSFSCRPGVGDAFMNLVEVLNLTAGNYKDVEPRTCQWSTPEIVSIPDSHSRTCSSVLPGGGVYIVGNQIAEGRDPVTLSLSKDGINFDRAFSVRYGAPPVKYPGEAKVVGFQYPGAVVLKDTMWVSYSLGKEDIGVTRFSLEELGL